MLIKDNSKDWMMVHSGRHVFPFEVNPDDIDIDDICHHLGNLCRYNGAPDEFYSVAEHSRHIFDALRRDGYPLETQLAGLLHDAPEYVLGDMIRPMKNSLGHYFPEARKFLKENEEHLGKLVAEKFGFPWPLPAAVEEYDARIINDEKAFIFGPGKPWNHGGEPLNVEIRCWNPAEARRQMKFAFYRVWKDLGRMDDSDAPIGA